MTVICAEAPIALLVEPWGVVPLTPCCAACASVGDYGFYCKACYEDVDGWFGDSWPADSASGWDQYQENLVSMCGLGRMAAAKIAGYAIAKVAAL